MIVTVHVKPKAKKAEISWLDESTAKASVREAAEKGRANEGVVALLAGHFRIAKSRISLVRGATTRIKQFSIDT